MYFLSDTIFLSPKVMLHNECSKDLRDKVYYIFFLAL
jgi:hypothetical protein